MTVARYIVGDVFQVLATLEDNSVDLVLTSPPFLALRSYLPADHPDKAKEIGSEPTPAAFIDTLLDVVEALDRVLAPHGSICIELGDTYSGSGGAGGDYNPGGFREGQQKFRQVPPSHAWRLNDDGSVKHDTATRLTEPKNVPNVVPVNSGSGWPLDKSLCLIPESFRWALVYGRNPFNGRETPRWRARNVIRWCRPNPPVGALGDKFRPATSEMVVLCKSRTRYFDLDAVRTAPVHGYDWTPGSTSGHSIESFPRGGGDASRDAHSHSTNPAGAPPLDWWNIPTQPYAGSHYATFPEQLCVTPIKAMSPMRVCRQCGEPSRRIVSEPEYVPSATNRGGSSFAQSERIGERVNQWVGVNGAKASVIRSTDTLGWSDCGCSCDRCAGKYPADCAAHWRPGCVLDPFAGSGTTLQVATGHGRDAIGIDLDPRNAQLAVDRVGPLLLTVEQGDYTP